MDIALAQEFLPDDSLSAFQQGLNTIKDAANAGADVVIFPELSFTPFYPREPADERDEAVRELAEPVPGPTSESVADIAADFGVVVIFNLLERDGDQTYNTSPVIDADGTLLGCTRMMHIPQYENFYEQDYYTPGDTGAPVYDTAAGRIGVAICYDRHYPEYMRALALQDAELVAVPQAGTAGEWPNGVYEGEARIASFQHGFFTAVANRVGQERNMLFEGRSLITDPSGRTVAQAPSGKAIILMASIDPDKCRESPAQELFLKHRRPKDYERGAVSLSASTPAHREALVAREEEATDDEASDEGTDEAPADEASAEEPASDAADADGEESLEETEEP
jgi:N-carbamoylputrescine amidase